MAPDPPVLVIDDDAVSRHVLERALTHAGIPSTLVSTGHDALAWLLTNTASLLLLDLVMPPPDGYEVLRAVRADPRTHDLPVVVLTALDSDEEIGRAFAAGADDFVRKPFRPVELIARIRGQLRLRGYIDALARKERDAQVVLELTQALSSSLDLRHILFTVVRRVAEVAGVDRCSIVLVREPGDLGYVAATSDDEELHDLSIELEKYPEIQQVMASAEPLIIENTATHPLLDVVRSDLPTDSVSSLAIVPIGYEGRTMGVLFLRARQRITIRQHELSLTRTIANATAIALRNAHVVKKLRDKTERVNVARFRAERRLRLLKRYAAFFESGADGIVVTDMDWQVLFSNDRARHITGYPEEQLHGRRFDQFMAPEHQALMEQLRDGLRTGLSSHSADINMSIRDGSSIILSVSFSGMLRDDGVVLLSFRDVTRERAVEEELKQTKEFLERVIDSSANAIVSFDATGIVRLFNRAAERCFMSSAEEVIGKRSARSLFPEDDGAHILSLLRDSSSIKTRIEDRRTHVLSQTLEKIPVSLSAARILEDDRPVGAVVVFTDLRDKLRMEARLAAAQEQLEARERQAIIAELAGAAAHELNQPLTSVMGYAELLKRKLDRGTAAFAAAEVIMNEAERMAEIVRKIGKITRYETKTYVGQAKILDLDRSSEDPPPGVRR